MVKSAACFVGKPIFERREQIAARSVLWAKAIRFHGDNDEQDELQKGR